MKTVVIKFKKSENFLNQHPYDTDYTVIRGCSLLNLTMDLAHKHGGLVCSFRDKEPMDTLKCKIVAHIPDEHKDLFIKDFLDRFMAYIEKVSWRIK